MAPNSEPSDQSHRDPELELYYYSVLINLVGGWSSLHPVTTGRQHDTTGEDRKTLLEFSLVHHKSFVAGSPRSYRRALPFLES